MGNRHRDPKAFNLGRRESLVVQGLLEIKERGPEELLKPGKLDPTLL